MSQKKNEGILFPTEIRVVGSYTDRLLRAVVGNYRESGECVYLSANRFSMA